MNDRLIREIYRYDKLGKIYHVDIDLDDYRDVYSEWDYSPFVNRDLDEDLLDFLMGCSVEISLKRNMVIDFFLPKEIYDSQREKRSIEGFRHYFSYRMRQMRLKRWQSIKNTLIIGFIGIVLLVAAYFVQLLMNDSVFSTLLSEGLVIGAWVAIWEIFTVIFFEVKNSEYKIKHYMRLGKTPLNYHYEKKK